MKDLTKTQQAIQILKHVEKPTQLIIIDIAKQIKCSERQVWTALSQLRKKNEEISEEFDLLKEIASDLMWISSYMEEEMQLKGEIKVRDKLRLNKISEHIEILKKDIKLMDYVRVKEDKEIEAFLRDVEGRRAAELQEYIRLKEAMRTSE